MRKKRIILFTACLLLLLSAAACSAKEKQPSSQDENKNERHIRSSAKTDFYAAGEEIEARAEVIIKAKRTSKEENICQNPQSAQQDVPYGYTTSMVQVEEIKKNTSSQPIKAGDELRVLEHQFSYMEGDTKVTCHLHQYKMMEPGREYILYLYYSQPDEWYVMPGAMQGKIPVSQDEDLLISASQFTGGKDSPPPKEDSQLYQAMKNIQTYTYEKWGIIRKCMEIEP